MSSIWKIEQQGIKRETQYFSLITFFVDHCAWKSLFYYGLISECLSVKLFHPAVFFIWKGQLNHEEALERADTSTCYPAILLLRLVLCFFAVLWAMSSASNNMIILMKCWSHFFFLLGACLTNSELLKLGHQTSCRCEQWSIATV